MADENQELRRVNWTELFSFTQIFKGFRMAIQPTKLMLALSAIVLVCLFGWALDCVWSWGGGRAQVGDVYDYYKSSSGDAYQQILQGREKSNRQALANWYAEADREAWSLGPVLKEYDQRGDSRSDFRQAVTGLIKEGQKDQSQPERIGDAQAMERVRKDPDEVWDDYEETTAKMLDETEDLFDDAEEKAEKKIRGSTDPQAAEEQLAKDVILARRVLWAVRVEMDRRHEQVYGRGISSTLANYEITCFSNAVAAVRRGNLFVGIGRVLGNRGGPPTASVSAAPAVPFTAQTDHPEGVGFFAWVFLMLWGPIWLISNHFLYGLIYLMVVLAIWAVFGGAIARMSALHAAREEKISFRQALRFSLSKFLSFFLAPLIPLAVILVLGFMLGTGGLLGLFPVGDIIMSVLFFLALILGAVVAFLSLGLVAGFPLMYPTIAVEGSDSFDAISRSFSYAFSRPWRLGLYTVVAVVYGAICYLFVRLFAFVMLLATHFFVSHGFFTKGMSWNSAPELADGANKLDLLWTKPTFHSLAGRMNWAATGGTETVASVIIHIWVYLVVGVVAAFVLTYWVSSCTSIYYLLRRKVDATDLDDVYVEDLGEPAEQETDQIAAPAEEPAAAEEAESAEPPAGEEQADEGEKPQE